MAGWGAHLALVVPGRVRLLLGGPETWVGAGEQPRTPCQSLGCGRWGGSSYRISCRSVPLRGAEAPGARLPLPWGALGAGPSYRFSGAVPLLLRVGRWLGVEGGALPALSRASPSPVTPNRVLLSMTPGVPPSPDGPATLVLGTCEALGFGLGLGRGALWVSHASPSPDRPVTLVHDAGQCLLRRWGSRLLLS